MSEKRKPLHLLRSLHQFGLNPSEWNLESLRRKECVVVSKKDPQFRFKGTLDHKGWTSLELASI